MTKHVKFILLLSVLLSATITAPLSAQTESPQARSSAFVFPAGTVSLSVRGGYRKFDGMDEYLRVERNSMFMYGGLLGKRFALKNKRLRFQAAVEAKWGSSVEEAYDDDTHEELNFSTIGIQTDMHILFPVNARTHFLSVGPGFHRSSVSFSHKGENEKILWRSEKINTLTPSFNIGAGIEYTINKHRAASLAYNFRIWSPVNYIETGDLFPMGVHYEEFFYTHALHVQILLPGTKKGAFK